MSTSTYISIDFNRILMYVNLILKNTTIQKHDN